MDRSINQATMTTIPDLEVDPGDVRRVILHWTAGGPTPNDYDLAPYHVLIDHAGRVIKGKFTVDDNISTSDGRYAAHTLHANTKAAGIALCGMRGAVERPLDFGPNPISESQFVKAAEVAASMLWHAGLPCEPHTCLSHAEVEGVLGIAQKAKWDISVLPWRSDIRGASAVGDYFRSLVRKRLSDMAPVALYRTDSATTLRAGNAAPLSQVRLLQQMLADLGYFSGKVDGLFGDLTKAAVMAFQDASGLTVDGVVGPMTWAELHAAPARPSREVTVADLRDAGSETIRAADRTEVGAVAVAGVGSAVTVMEHIAGAEGAVASLDAMLRAYWPVAAFAAVGFGGWYLARRLRSIRLEDAVSGRNLGR